MRVSAGNSMKPRKTHPDPRAATLYSPAHEHDSCGVGFVVNIGNKKDHAIIQDGLRILRHLEHRGATGAEPDVGDGAGILIQTPHLFVKKLAEKAGCRLPEEGAYAIGHIFMPPKEESQKQLEALIESNVLAQEQHVLFWRDVPVDDRCLGQSAKHTAPVHRQIIVARGAETASIDDFERKLLTIRRLVEKKALEMNDSEIDEFFYISSLSARTLVYKGMFLANQIEPYYRDLTDPDLESALALVHQRFSTNTFPSWRLAHPYRMIAHNGEINTLRSNINWMRARHATLRSALIGGDMKHLLPVIPESQSDSASFDNALEFMLRGGFSLAHAMMMLIPEAWANNHLMDDERRAFYEYHAALMEPWDGPAAVAFTNGLQIGATLDRNGLRPARYLLTDDERVIMASESGVLPVAEEKIIKKWRLQPGKMLLIDLEQGRIIDDKEIKKQLARAQPYQNWLARTQIILEDLPLTGFTHHVANISLLNRQQAFGYTQEDEKFLLTPMAETGQEAVGSMGNDTPLSALSGQSKLLYTYFKQNFAQVTNPPIDPIREELVMSLVSFIGPRPNLFDSRATRRKRLEVRQPILRNEDLEKIRMIGNVSDDHFRTKTLDITYAQERGSAAMERMITRLCERALSAVKDGYNIIILSDRLMNHQRVAIPALLATSAVHHFLIQKGMRTSAGLVVETGEARETHHFACLAGYGAEAINPWLAFETIDALRLKFDQKISAEDAIKRYIKAVNKGLLKVMSKMGISTYQSYCGAQIFDAVGLASDFVRLYFTGTASQVEGVALGVIAAEAFQRHEQAFGNAPVLQHALNVGGEYAVRLRGEDHVWRHETVRDLQHAVRSNDRETYQNFAQRINEQNTQLMSLRGLFHIKKAEEISRKAIPLEEVEPAASIVKRFSTGAMSFGSISREAHTTLARTMNRIGGKSNTGEGGEEPDRYRPLPNGDSMRSAIKQVASGRFGVTAEYLVNADMIQIKMAQGAKPGEGGQLPGHKVDPVIAKVRYSTPGVGLISPPPHHDIYSIEDLAQLIFDLKNVNPAAAISVKLVSEVGVGTVAAGVAKARADHVTISGFEGGTGASPLTSIKHAGSPWEIGLAETHQTLILNRLRSRISVQVDGGLRTGRDVVIAALLGADEFGFSTAPLIAIGCIMMRKCHLNTCPVGIATQDPVLRKRFRGAPEHAVNYFFFVAEEARQIMAQMGVARFDDMIGRSDFLNQETAIAHWKARGLDMSRVLAKPKVATPLYKCEPQKHQIENILDRQFIKAAQPALDHQKPISIKAKIHNTDRTTGAMLSGEIAKRFGHKGLKEDTISIRLEGQAGQSFGAWLAHGISMELVGEANDYVGKGLAGGRLVIYPPAHSTITPEESIIVGNTVLYGAIAGSCYFRGVAGERFAVRNSGAVAVVEGCGDHGCEYMTGGIVVVLGETGRNFAAGMSGGVAYVFDQNGDFEKNCNLAMVELQPIEAEDRTLEQRAHQGGDLEMHGLVDVMSDMTRFDAERLRQLIENHAHYTNSAPARALLENWEVSLKKFVKIMPVDYQRALKERQSLAGQPLAISRSR